MVIALLILMSIVIGEGLAGIIALRSFMIVQREFMQWLTELVNTSRRQR